MAAPGTNLVDMEFSVTDLNCNMTLNYRTEMLQWFFVPNSVDSCIHGAGDGTDITVQRVNIGGRSMTNSEAVTTDTFKMKSLEVCRHNAVKLKMRRSRAAYESVDQADDLRNFLPQESTQPISGYSIENKWKAQRHIPYESNLFSGTLIYSRLLMMSIFMHCA
jgi:hypothetical protein